MSEEKKEQQVDINVIAKAFSSPEGTFVKEPETTPETEGGQPGDPIKPEGTDQNFNPNPAWNILAEKFGLEIPQDLSPENELEVFSSTLEKIKPQEVQIHPIARELNDNLSNPDFKFDEWVKQKTEITTLSTLKGKEFFEKILPMEYPDATPEEIQEIIQEMESSGSMKLQELQLKKGLKEKEAQRMSEYEKTRHEQMRLAIEQENNIIQQETEKLFAETKNISEIYGIPISEAERNDFNKVFSELVKRDETGKVPLSELLQSNLDVWKFAYMTLSGAPKFKEALFEAKEGTKAQIFNKIKSTPSPGIQKAAGTPGPKKPNYGAFKQPQQ